MKECALCGSEINTLSRGWKRLDGGEKVCQFCAKGGEEDGKTTEVTNCSHD